MGVLFRNRVFWMNVGPDYYRDRPLQFSFVLWPRLDLMDRRADQGRLVLCLFAMSITWGWKFYFRSDVGEIADRLAAPPPEPSE